MNQQKETSLVRTLQGKQLTAGEWLKQEMELRCLTARELCKRMATENYKIGTNNISLWKSGSNSIPTHAIGPLLIALGLKGPEAEYWAFQLFRTKVPKPMWHFLNDPTNKWTIDDVRAMKKKRKAELDEISNAHISRRLAEILNS